MTELASAALLVAGAAFYCAGTVGLLRFPDVYTRLHPLSEFVQDVAVHERLPVVLQEWPHILHDEAVRIHGDHKVTSTVVAATDGPIRMVYGQHTPDGLRERPYVLQDVYPVGRDVLERQLQRKLRRPFPHSSEDELDPRHSHPSQNVPDSGEGYEWPR